MIEEKSIISAGKFQKTHGLKGELNALLDIDAEYFEEGNPMILDVDGIYVPFFVDGVRSKGVNSYLVRIEGIDTEADAKRFVNNTIYAERSALAPFLDMEEDEMREEDDLIGYYLIDEESGDIIGDIERIDSTTSNVLFIVRTVDGDIVYVPAVDEFLESVDDEAQEITMRLPKGLIDLNKKNTNEEE